MVDRLSLEEAEMIVDAALSESERRGVKVAIAVVDAHGELIMLVKMDTARDYYADVAYGKAMSSAIFEDASRSVGRIQAPGGENQRFVMSSIHQRVNQLHGNRIVYAPGAIPLRREGIVIGAVGVGGSGPDSDEAIATHGAKVLHQGS
jgi:uncharacterized protein GlcG (DUF336 family)